MKVNASLVIHLKRQRLLALYLLSLSFEGFSTSSTAVCQRYQRNQQTSVKTLILALERLAGITDTYDPRITKGGGTVRKGDTLRYKLFSSHSGRRTFATQCVLKSVPFNLIMLCTGHHTLEKFDKYVKMKEIQGEMELRKLEYFKEEITIVTSSSIS